MPYLDTYTQPLTAKTAAHLLRRATIGPTQSEIASFTPPGGMTATQAVALLIQNGNYSPPVPLPIELDSTKPNAGQTFLDKPFNGDRNYWFGMYIKYWWYGLMTAQNNKPVLLEKLALFWQNHFVTTREVVDDHRFVWQYLQLLRNNSLGNFRTLVTEISKDPAMLKFLNGNENEKGKPNENYARELQELFTVGKSDFAGNPNYTEDDVKAAARTLTGWKFTNYWVVGSTTFGTSFTANKHDTDAKSFSDHYGLKIIPARTTPPAGYATTGEADLAELITMLLSHPETPKFICRKLYRWYVNPNVTQAIEDNVIVPLAQLFASPANNWAIRPVIEKLLTSQIFFDASNIAAIVKSPVDLVLGSLKFFNQPIPNMTTNYTAYLKLFDFAHWRMRDMQMDVLDQPTVFGYEPYYQTGYSKIWMNTTTIALRSDFTDAFIGRWLVVDPNYYGTGVPYKMGIDLLAWATALQPDFRNPPPTTGTGGTVAITCEIILADFIKNLFATDLFQTQQDFLIDKIMMQDVPRSSWGFEWNNYRRVENDRLTRLAQTPPNTTLPTNYNNYKNAVTNRLQNLMKYLLRMAEYHIS